MKIHLPIFSDACRFVLPLVLFTCTSLGLCAQEPLTSIDFEDMDSALPGFGVVLKPVDGAAEYGAATKWQEPFRVSLSQDQPHAGEQCLLWEFFEDSSGSNSLSFPVLVLPGNGGKVSVRFFVRTENIFSDGILAIGLMDERGAHLKTLYGVAPIPSGSTWVAIEWEGEVEPEVAGLRTTVVYKDVQAPAKVWLDDLSLPSQ